MGEGGFFPCLLFLLSYFFEGERAQEGQKGTGNKLSVAANLMIIISASC